MKQEDGCGSVRTVDKRKASDQAVCQIVFIMNQCGGAWKILIAAGIDQLVKKFTFSGSGCSADQIICLFIADAFPQFKDLPFPSEKVKVRKSEALIV